MSSRPSAPVVDLTPGSSWPLVGFVTGVTVLAATAVYFSSIPLPGKATAMTVILAAGVYWVFDRGMRLMPFSITRVMLLQDDECVMFDRRGQYRSMELAGGLTLGTLCVVLMLRQNRWRSLALCLSSDSVPQEIHRRLRMRLRMSIFTRNGHFAESVSRLWGKALKKQI